MLVCAILRVRHVYLTTLVNLAPSLPAAADVATATVSLLPRLLVGASERAGIVSRNNCRPSGRACLLLVVPRWWMPLTFETSGGAVSARGTASVSKISLQLCGQLDSSTRQRLVMREWLTT